MFRVDIHEAGYSRGKPILKDVSLKDIEGRRILISGASGSGKTTFVLAFTGVLTNLLHGYLDGSVEISGLNPLDIDDFIRLPERLGVVLQDPDKQLAMPKTIDEILFTLENIGYSYEEALVIAKDYLELTGLWEKRYSHVEELSGGEKRRLTIASALAHDPEIIIFDEVTASMDPWGIESIRRYIEDIKSEKTVIIIEHKARYFLDLVDNVYVISDGRLLEVDDKELGGYGVDITLEKRFNRDEREYGEDILNVENLSIGYEEPILDSINLRLRRGEIIGIVGRNGSGKTTLLKTLAGFIKPLDGRIEKNGRIFYVPQAPDRLFMFRSVMDEIVNSCRKIDGECEDYIKTLDMFGIPVDQTPFKLSHGQRRWLANYIASIYSRDIILFDEPTTGLDLNLYMWIAEQILELSRQDRGIIIATHDPRILIDLCDRAFIIDGEFYEVDVDEAVEYLEKPVSIFG